MPDRKRPLQDLLAELPLDEASKTLGASQSFTTKFVNGRRACRAEVLWRAAVELGLRYVDFTETIARMPGADGTPLGGSREATRAR